MSSGTFSINYNTAGGIYEGRTTIQIALQQIIFTRLTGPLFYTTKSWEVRYSLDNTSFSKLAVQLNPGNTFIRIVINAINMPLPNSYYLRIYNLTDNQYYTSSDQLLIQSVEFSFSPTTISEEETATITSTIQYPAYYTTWPTNYTYILQYYNGSWIDLDSVTTSGTTEYSTIQHSITAGELPAGEWSIRVAQYSDATLVATYSEQSSTQLIVEGPPLPLCFGKGSLILTAFGQVPVEDLVVGDSLVKTASGGYRRVSLIKHMTVKNPPVIKYNSAIIPSNTNYAFLKTRNKACLYVCDATGYSDAGMTESDGKLILTGAHSVLVLSLTDAERKAICDDLGQAFVTEEHYRLPVYLDVRSRPYEVEGEFTVYHFALEDKWEHRNYGVYANGLLVESASNWHLQNSTDGFD